MILYRLASDNDINLKHSLPSKDSNLLIPPKPSSNLRHSTVSSSRSSFISIEMDSKYTGLSHRDSAFPTTRGGLVPYEYDPALDELDPVDDEDLLHDPTAKGKVRRNSFPWRGIMNVAVLLFLISGLLALFVFYPVFLFYRDRTRNSLIDGNIRINATGMSFVFFFLRLPYSLRPPSRSSSRSFPNARPRRYADTSIRTLPHRL